MEQVLTPPPIIEQFKKNGVTHVIWLPDSETNLMYELMTREEKLKIVPVCREGQSTAIAAGVLVGGKKPVVLI